MRLLFVRHAAAVPADEAGVTDVERPLSRDGARRFRRAAAGLAAALPRPEKIWTSPARRARETAELLARACKGPPPEPSAALIDGAWDDLARLIDGASSEDTVVVVGHEDWLSAVTARLLGCPSGDALQYRKGGAALLELPVFAPGQARLLWFLPPRLLRRLH